MAPACLADLLQERAPVLLDMARRLGKAFGNGARYWLALQMQHDVWKAERDDALDIAPIAVAAAPIASAPRPLTSLSASARR